MSEIENGCYDWRDKGRRLGRAIGIWMAAVVLAGFKKGANHPSVRAAGAAAARQKKAEKLFYGYYRKGGIGMDIRKPCCQKALISGQTGIVVCPVCGETFKVEDKSGQSRKEEYQA